MDTTGDAYTATYRASMETRILNFIHQGLTVPGLYTPADLPEYTEFLGASIRKFETSHQAVYLGVSGLRRCAHGVVL